MIVMAGTKQKALDSGGRYRKQCGELAEALGWQGSAVYEQWRQIAMIREFEQGWPRAVAEWQAMRDVTACLYKPGQEGD